MCLLPHFCPKAFFGLKLKMVRAGIPEKVFMKISGKKDKCCLQKVLDRK
jgi:hypothetical protein